MRRWRHHNGFNSSHYTHRFGFLQLFSSRRTDLDFRLLKLVRPAQRDWLLNVILQTDIIHVREIPATGVILV
jgi:hypothetical protein